MKNAIKLLAGLAFLFVVTFAQAQSKEMAKDDQTFQKDKASKDEKIAKRFDKMAKKLNLTADQKAQLWSLERDYADRMKSIRDNATDKAAAKQQLKQLRDGKKADVQNILSPEQYAKYEKGSKRRNKRGKKRRRNRRNS